MADKLSQEEIDALINSFQTGGEELVESLTAKDASEKDYRLYDFNRPEKFSIENLKSIERIAITFSKNLSQTLTTRMRTPFNVEFSSIEQIPFVTDYADIMTKDYYAFCVTDLGNPELHEIVVELDLAFIMAVHRRLLGNEIPKELGERKVLTTIEQLTALKILDNIIYENLETAFDSVASVNPSFVTLQTDSQLLKITSATDMIALVTLTLSCEYWNTTIRLVIPFESVEEVIDKFTVENIMEFSPNKKNKSYKKEIEKGLENVLQEVYISVGESQITIKELSELQEGDFLKFNNKVIEPVKGYASGVHKFNCLIGKEGNKKAIRFLNFTDNAGEGM
jgi:flagellar motor switch protein FliM